MNSIAHQIRNVLTTILASPSSPTIPLPLKSPNFTADQEPLGKHRMEGRLLSQLSHVTYNSTATADPELTTTATSPQHTSHLCLLSPPPPLSHRMASDLVVCAQLSLNPCYWLAFISLLCTWPAATVTFSSTSSAVTPCLRSQ